MDLIERDDVLAALLSLVASALSGRGQVAIVVAPAGGGKTAVLDAVRRSAGERGAAVLAGAGVEQEMVIPYGLVHQLLDPLVRRKPALVLDGPPARAWAQLASGADADPTVPRGLHWLIDDAARAGPIVLIVDDHQWCDRPTAAFLDYLAHRIAPMPVALIVATRDASTVLDLGAPSTMQLALDPLTRSGVGALAVGRLGAAATQQLVEALCGATGGNPFLVHEALAVLRDEPGRPPERAITVDLVAAVRRRMRGLDDDARRVTEALAILSSAPSPDVVAEVVGLDLRTTLSCGDRLIAAHLTTDDACFTLRHPLVRSAVLAAMSSGRSSILHRRAADALSRRGGSAVDIGQHLLHVQPQADPTVAGGLCAAGRAALAHDPHSARLLLERARAEPPAARQLAETALLLGSAYRALGDERAVDELRDAFEAAGPRDLQVEAVRGLLGALLSFGRLDELDDTIANELSQLTSHDPEAALTVEAELLSAARHATHVTLWKADRLRRWMGRVRGQSAAERVLLANLATQAALDGGSAEHTAALARAALAGHRLVTEQTADSLSVYQAIWQLTAADCLDEAQAALDAAFADARERSSIIGFALASLFSSYVELARGAVGSAESSAHAALVAAEQLTSHWMVLPAIVAAVVDIDLERGAVAASWALLERHRLLGALPDSTPHRLLLYTRARLHDACGNTGEAVADADELVHRQAAANVLSAHLVPSGAIAALAHAHRGDVAIGREHADHNLRLATAWGTPRVVGRALVVQAQLQPPDLAVGTLDEAIERLERAAAPIDRGWAHHHRGLTNVHLGKRADAITDLRAALDLAAATGATALARTSRERLVRLGLRPRRSALTGRDALTVSERQVADLAARGHTNRDIAAALFVTPRTVETHLTSAYRKLGIRRRSQLAAALTER